MINLLIFYFFGLMWLINKIKYVKYMGVDIFRWILFYEKNIYLYYIKKVFNNCWIF